MNTNQVAIQMIIGTLAILALTCVITICVLSIYGAKIPSELNTLAGSFGSGLLGMLVKTTPTSIAAPPA